MPKSNTKRTPTTLEYEFTLAFDEAGSLRMTRGDAALGSRERSIRMKLVVPRNLFREPTLSAVIKIADDGRRGEIVAKVEAAAAKALRENLDVGLNLSIVAPGGGER